MARHLRLLLAVPLLLAFAPAPKPKEDDAKAVQGTWKMVRLERGGRPANEEWAAVTKVVIKGNRLEVHEDRLSETLTLELDPKKKPKQMTLRVVYRPEDSLLIPPYPGIYKLEKDTLTLCYCKGERPARPTEFKTKPGSMESMLVLKRVKP